MTPLTVLYTANLRGDLDVLPRLYTFIRQVKAQPVEDESEVLICAVEPLPQRVVLLDLGGSCAPEVWHCAATGGRSTLLVLDAMGYHAVNVAGLLTDEARERLAGNVLTLALVDGKTAWQQGEVAMTLSKGDLVDRPYRLQIIGTPAAQTQIAGKTLTLANVTVGQIGVAHIDLTTAPKLLAHTIFDLPSTTLPDPTIAAAVDFVMGEARYFQSRHA